MSSTFQPSAVKGCAVSSFTFCTRTMVPAASRTSAMRGVLASMQRAIASGAGLEREDVEDCEVLRVGDSADRVAARGIGDDQIFAEPASVVAVVDRDALRGGGARGA